MNTKKIIFGAITAGFLMFTFFSPLNVSAKPQDSQRQQVPDNPAVPPAPVQPIPYSHKTHLALDLQCQTCHTNPEPGAMMTFPAAATCMGCHDMVAAKKPAIVKLSQFAKSAQPIPWVRVYTLTPGIQWSHRKHLEAGVKCETCHGPVASLEAMTIVKSVTAMGACINCHQMNNAKTACRTCHLWP